MDIIQRNKKLQSDLNRMTKLRFEERKGRTKAEKLLRENDNKIIDNNNNDNVKYLNLRIIGTFHSPFNDRRGTPRQGVLVPSAIGYIEFSKWIQPQSTLDGLVDNFSHIWVIWQFHQNTNSHNNKLNNKNNNNLSTSLGCKAKIKPPRLNGQKIGIFACRTPHRPNPIGLTKCKIIKMDNKLNRLYLSHIDMINNTPIIDIKPYIPYCDITKDALIPKWCIKDELLFNNIIYINGKKENHIINLLKKSKYFNEYFHDNLNGFKTMFEEILIRDIRSLHQRSLHQRNNNKHNNKLFECKICDIIIKYTINDKNKTVKIVDAYFNHLQ